MITHQYNKDIKENKKFDNKAIILDFNFFLQLTEKKFIDQFDNALTQFLNLLKQTTEKNTPSSHTQQREVKTATIATVSTDDPTVTITLSFEVNLHFLYFVFHPSSFLRFPMYFFSITKELN